MNKIEYLLECLTEECAEVIQRVCKAQRFGLNEVQKGQELTNEERIDYELRDLATIIYMLKDEGLDLSLLASYDKQEKVEKYMELSRKEGRLK